MAARNGGSRTRQKEQQSTRVRIPESQAGHGTKRQRTDGTTTGQQRRTLGSTPNDATKADWSHECRQCPTNGRAPGMEPTNEHVYRKTMRSSPLDGETTSTKIRIS